MHLAAEIAQAQPGVAGRPLADEFGDRVFQPCIIVMQALEGDERAQQGAGLARLDAGRQQEQERIQIVFLRDDAVFAQILRDDGRRNAVPA